MRPCAAAILVCLTGIGVPLAASERPPNVLLIFADDLGYADIEPYGATNVRTPNINRLANEGTNFTSFYVAQAVCTASRAALMTGCYANRVGLAGALNHTSTTGLNPDETTIAEVFQQRGYRTACFGKWHLGQQPSLLPTRQGFDEFMGLPYSNDNGPLHPVVRDIPALPWFEGERIVERDPDQSQFTRRLTERAIRFLEADPEKPFFLYLPHIMPHVPIFASDRFRGQSASGLYGDVIEELDWGVGELFATLDRLKLTDNTWVIFTSDNGPFLSYGEHAGRAAPLREGKLTTFEGGVRTPCLMRWPGRIPAGRVCDELISTIDLLPTVCGLLDVSVPQHSIDGKNVAPVLFDEPNAVSPHEAFYCYAGNELQAIRSGRWKLHLPHEYLTVNGPPGRGGKPANWENMKPLSITESGIRGIASRHGYKVESIGLSLFDLSSDPGETTNVADKHPEVVAKLLEHAEAARIELGDSLTQRVGRGIRPVGQAVESR